MRTVILSGLALTLLAGAALAQATPSTPPTGAPGPAATTAAPPPAPGGDAGPGGALPPPPTGIAGPGAPPPPPPPGGPDGHRPPPPPPAGPGARFHLEAGDRRLDIKCADADSTRACGDVVMQLLDRLQAAPKP